MNRPPRKQPGVTARSRVEPPGDYGQESPDPDAHLTEEQKKWPVVTELLPPTGEAPNPESAAPTPKLPPAA